MMEAKLKQKEDCIPENVEQNFNQMHLSLRFSSNTTEEGYMKSRGEDLIKHGRIGCFLSSVGFLLVAAIGNLSTPDTSLERWWFVLPHVVMFWFLGFACCSHWCLSRISFLVREWICILALMCSMISIVLMAPAYDRAMHRASHSSDSSVVLSLTATVLGTHLLLPIRWFLLVFLQIFSVLAYLYYILHAGNAKQLPEENIVLFSICVLLLSLGTRSAEIRGRESFAHVAIARELRAQARQTMPMPQILAKRDISTPEERSRIVAGLCGPSNQSPVTSILSGQISSKIDHSTPTSLDYSISVLGSNHGTPTASASEKINSVKRMEAKLQALQTYNKETQTDAAWTRNAPTSNAEVTCAGHASETSRTHETKSAASLSTKPPLAPKSWKDNPIADDQCSSASSQTLERQLCGQKLMASNITPTSLKICCRSLEQNIKHWNLGYDSSACCPFHAATRVCGAAFRKLSRQPCNPLWSPFLDWSCSTCTCANHRQALHCAVCGQARCNPRTSDELSLSFNAYSGKVITSSNAFANVFGDFPPGSLCFLLFKPIQRFWKIYQTHVDDIQNIIDRQADIEDSESLSSMEAATSSFSHLVYLEQPSSGFLPIQYQATCHVTIESSEGVKDGRDAEELGVIAHIVLTDLTLRVCPYGKSAISL